jgi:putative membrane protein
MGAHVPDPRVFFAAERTLLAWIRTGITVIALGFVVARFGLFLKLLARQIAPSTTPAAATELSSALGVLLNLIGTAAIIAAVLQYRSFVSTLPDQDLPPRHRPSWAVTFALAIALCGVILAIYLAQ